MGSLDVSKAFYWIQWAIHSAGSINMWSHKYALCRIAQLHTNMTTAQLQTLNKGDKSIMYKQFTGHQEFPVKGKNLLWQQICWQQCNYLIQDKFNPINPKFFNKLPTQEKLLPLHWCEATLAIKTKNCWKLWHECPRKRNTLKIHLRHDPCQTFLDFPFYFSHNLSIKTDII